MPFLRTGIAVRIRGYSRASQARNKHQDDTKANWITVSVIGLGNVMRIALEEVFDSTDVVYHTPQSSFRKYQPCLGWVCWSESALRTTSFGESGAFKASAISCAFWLTLPPRVRIVVIASLKLFCLPCLATPLAQCILLSFRGCQRPSGSAPMVAGIEPGLGLLEAVVSPKVSSYAGNASDETRGKLYVGGLNVDEEEERRSTLVKVADGMTGRS